MAATSYCIYLLNEISIENQPQAPRHVTDYIS